MLVNSKATRFQVSVLPSPSNSPPPSLIFTDSDDEAMSSSEEHLNNLYPSSSTLSRPVSVVFAGLSPYSPHSPRPPSLREILANTAPPPWTLAAFTSHLSQNHCLENLEFVIDAEKYKREYTIFKNDFSDVSSTAYQPKRDEIKRLWVKIVRTYIAPNSQREVNIRGEVRDDLLHQPNESSPPPPEALDEAVTRVYELMNDSVMLTFISELSPARPHISMAEQMEDSEDKLRFRTSPILMRHRSRSRRKTSPLEVTSNFAPEASRSHFLSPQSALADDFGSLLSPTQSPITPPTTPPSSEGGEGSPRLKSDNSWKKMFGRLGTKKKGSGGSSSASDSSPSSPH